MFYCEECRAEREWPESMAKSRGPCEICGKVATCNDRASSTLPLPDIKMVHIFEQKITPRLYQRTLDALTKISMFRESELTTEERMALELALLRMSDASEFVYETGLERQAKVDAKKADLSRIDG